MLETLDQAAVNYQLVLTKADEVKEADQASLIAAVMAAIAQHPAAYPELLVTSARTGAGLPELRSAIARLLAERAPPTRSACLSSAAPPSASAGGQLKGAGSGSSGAASRRLLSDIPP